jgi:FtsP/CotA-like multicopper oxidase with cupredoxin domain
MRTTITKKATSMKRLLPLATAAALSYAGLAQAAAPGISSTTGTAATFNLDAAPAYINQPDGNQVYSWGYGCTASTTVTPNPTFVPAAIGVTQGASCSTMQIPGPTLVVTEGQTVTVTLTNNLPTAAGNTSILFPGFNVTATPGTGVPGLLTQEAAPGGTVTYTFTATSPGTRAYYSGTQGDLQVEMGLYGAIIVLPATAPTTCSSGLAAANLAVETAHGEADFRLPNASGTPPGAAYDHPDTCYDREYLFQFSEMDVNIHRAALAQVLDPNRTTACGPATAPTPNAPGCPLQVPTEPYHPAYFLINGRSMPDDMDPNYDSPYPHQPYNGNPHMHPGENTLLRVIGQGRWEHPFHEHANHVRILARDGNPVISPSPLVYPGTSVPPANITAQALAGMLMFTTDTIPGQSFDGIFYFTAKGLNWDAYGHDPKSTDPLAQLPCNPDLNGYWTANSPGFFNTTVNPTGYGVVNYYEWCQDHNKPLEANPFGDVNAGGPMTLPNPNIFTNGAWYGGSPYLGPDATVRGDNTLRGANGNSGNTSGCLGVAGAPTLVAAGTATQPTVQCTNLQPSNTQANPANERGWAFMWHSHNEREITTDNVFPGGMLMMMLVDSREFVIDESK